MIDGFVGKDCELVDLCFDNPCQNNSTCLLIGDGKNFDCACNEGFSGLTCEIADICSDSPCFNNGTCMPINGTSFECDCSGTGGAGPLCKRGKLMGLLFILFRSISIMCFVFFFQSMLVKVTLVKTEALAFLRTILLGVFVEKSLSAIHAN